MTYDASFDVFINAALGKKAYNIIALDVHSLTSIADMFILLSGSSNRQVSALAEHIEKDLRKQGIKPLSVEGRKEGHWVLMDYGYVVIHIFYESVRELYDLEGLWRDAGRIRISHEDGSAADQDKFQNGDQDNNQIVEAEIII